MPQSPSPTPHVKLNLRVNDKDYKAKGETILEALEALEVVEIPKTRALLTAYDGKKSTERQFTPIQLRKFYADKTHKQIIAKRMEMTLK